jgi:hypothetical protein
MRAEALRRAGSLSDIIGNPAPSLLDTAGEVIE